MTIPDVSAEKITNALREFDQSFRESSEYRDWETNGNYRYALVVNDRRYPPKKILSLATGISTREFSGGPETNGYLERRGFSVVSLRPSELQQSFERILERYQISRTTEPFNAQAEMLLLFGKVEDDFQALEEVRAFSTIRVKAGVGQGSWAKVPWIAFLDERETRSTRKGIYVVFLFRQDGSGVYAALNQGVTGPRERLGDARGLEEVREKAREIRLRPECKMLERVGFQLDDGIDLRADAGLGRSYEPSTIAYKLYERGSVPSDDQIVNDLKLFLSHTTNISPLSKLLAHPVAQSILVLPYSL